MASPFFLDGGDGLVQSFDVAAIGGGHGGQIVDRQTRDGGGGNPGMGPAHAGDDHVAVVFEVVDEGGAVVDHSGGSLVDRPRGVGGGIHVQGVLPAAALGAKAVNRN